MCRPTMLKCKAMLNEAIISIIVGVYFFLGYTEIVLDYLQFQKLLFFFFLFFYFMQYILSPSV